jgi:DNA topoisomerase VI subunit B
MGDKYKLEIIDSGIGIPKKSNSIYSTLFWASNTYGIQGMD